MDNKEHPPRTLQVSGYSTALFATWLFVEDFNLLFDAGDGVSAALGLKSQKAQHIFISHADRDHLAGLMQLLQLNSHEGKPCVYYPKDSQSFPALRNFLAKFDPHSGPATWRGLDAGERIYIAKDRFVEARANRHIVVEDQVKSLEFTLFEEKRKLRPEFHGLPGAEIAALRAEHGDDHVTEVLRAPLLGFSGDSPGLDPSRWGEVAWLIHEATFLDPHEAREAHSNLPQVLHAAAAMPLAGLLLTHFSFRYDHDTIRAAIYSLAQKLQITFPIFALLPGEMRHHLLVDRPVWPGRVQA